MEWLAVDSEMLPCSWHRLSDAGLVTIWPAEYRQWARTSGLTSEADVVNVSRVQPSAMKQKAVVAKPSLQVVNPPAGAVYLIDPTLRRDFQTLALRATASAAGRIEWRVDGRVVGTARSDSPFLWKLSPGSHRVTAHDRTGRTAEAGFVVK